MLNQEQVLIPYQTSSLPPGPWLVFAPHADDETFGMGGSLTKANQQGIETHVIVITDGALGGDSDDLVAVRDQEVRRAIDLLGVKSLQCWQEPDRGIESSERLMAITSQAICELAPASVFFPGALEIHPDHRATAQLVWAALQGLPDADPTPQAYAYEICVQNPVNRLIDITAQLAVKQQAMAIYASQNSQNNYPELVLALNKTRTFSLPDHVSHAEGFYCFAAADLSQSLQDVMRKVMDLYH
ncbi:MAG: PIG-L family deacetylase [Proteobacteria bacterium]|nr:PIG-L family deacetylase [Pseudomonadota bacterium]